MNASPVRAWSAILPLVMALLGPAMLMDHVALYGVVREADEGTPTNIFQLLMVLQTPIIAFFALKWFPVAPRITLIVLALQIAASLAAVAAVILVDSLACGREPVKSDRLTYSCGR